MSALLWGLPLTWSCHVCGEERPDEVIAVWKTDLSDEYALPPGTFWQHVRYCTDRPACRRGAPSVQHFHHRPLH